MAGVALSRLTKEYAELQRNAAKRQAAAAAAAAAAMASSSAGGAAAAASGGDGAAARVGAAAAASTVVATALPVGRTSLSACRVSDFDADDSDIVLFPTDTHAGAGNAKPKLQLLQWTAFITGPPDSPYENARFELRLQVPGSYPHSPPAVHFVTRVFHPNVHWPKGDICLDILKSAWTPVWTLETTCRAVIFLLANPAADSPLNCDAGNLLRAGDARGYYSLARSCAVEHAHFQPKHCPPALSVVALTAPLRRVAGAEPTVKAMANAVAGAAAAASAEGKHQSDAAGTAATPAFVQFDAAHGNAAGGSAPSAPGSSLANTFVYLSHPVLSANAAAASAKVAAAAASAVVGGGAAQHKTAAA